MFALKAGGNVEVGREIVPETIRGNMSMEMSYTEMWANWIFIHSIS